MECCNLIGYQETVNKTFYGTGVNIIQKYSQFLRAYQRRLWSHFRPSLLLIRQYTRSYRFT